MQLKLLHLIAWLPAHRFGTFSMSLAVFAWHWICAESPQLQVASLNLLLPSPYIERGVYAVMVVEAEI